MKRFCSRHEAIAPDISEKQNFIERFEKTKAERHARGFGSWDQFVATTSCHLADANSLRRFAEGWPAAKVVYRI